AARRSLPSFPTRRSSDLSATFPVMSYSPYGLLPDSKEPGGARYGNPSESPSRFAWPVPNSSPHGYRRLLSPRPAFSHSASVGRRDRKSTRLNSSHGSISY